MDMDTDSLSRGEAYVMDNEKLRLYMTDEDI